MLSYRHAFHAGNHADVLKHTVLIALLDHLNHKDKPWWYIDTHAGAGVYDLSEAYAQRNGEFAGGIGRLWLRSDLPPQVEDYVAVVRALNPDGKLRFYPGSPWCAAQRARRGDRLQLFELHGSDVRLLEDTFAEAGRYVRVEGIDGYAGLKSVLPPASRRALTLIDPSYEVKTDYQRTVDALGDSLRRFPTGVYAIWYPLLQRAELRQMLAQLGALGVASWLRVSLSVQAPAADGFGMYGSGLYIVNPPWTLPAELQTILPWLVSVLGLDAGASHALDWQIP